MITVEEAEKKISEICPLFSSESCFFDQADGRILHEDIYADRDFPPYDRITMDGIALSFAAWKKGQRVFLVEGIHHAGRQAPSLENPNACWEVTTGAVLPEGCDCVIRVEDLKFQEGSAHLDETITVTQGQNIHPKGSDYPQGGILLKKGDRLLSPQAAVLASVGKKEVLVGRYPKIAIISNGDELVEVGETAEPYQVRRSNPYVVYSALKREGYKDVHLFHIPDDEIKLREELERILNEFEMIIMSGGVSMGRYDFIPQTLSHLGVKKVFHKVAQRPGKPFWFGKSPGGKVVFALPGNPVTVLVCLHRYILPQLERSLGVRNPRSINVVLGEDFSFSRSLTYFLPVRVENVSGLMKAYPMPTNGSGDFVTAAQSDGFIELSALENHFSQGYVAPFYPWYC